MSGRLMMKRLCQITQRRSYIRDIGGLTSVISGNEVHGFKLRGDSSFRVHFHQENKRISPWHDIVLFPDDNNKRIMNFVNEIPKYSCEKMEIATKEEFNPIKQDEKKGKLRFYPFASLVNYGCLPQTWEDPTKSSHGLEFKGDNDPIDVVEVGSRVAKMGEVLKIKVIGSLGMIDEGEMDWKVIGIDVNDPMASDIESVSDLERLKPGKVREIVNWFKYYKVPDDKPINEFAFNEEALEFKETLEIIEETHEFWKNKEALAKEGLWFH